MAVSTKLLVVVIVLVFLPHESNLARLRRGRRPACQPHYEIKPDLSVLGYELATQTAPPITGAVVGGGSSS